MSEATFHNRYVPKSQIINEALGKFGAPGGGRNYFSSAPG